ncbi:MAG: efflux RND transporter periplasmic adaptor subunit [Bacteroidetes bacterium]|nr:efflux RND transporter periplasmic adaptor subunit [Bacteroidota bacterium]
MNKPFLYLSIASILLFSCKKKREHISPIEEKITESVYASGVVKSNHQYQVFSTTNGIIASILVAKGDIVKQGDAIISITNTTAKLNTENAKIAVDYAATSSNSEKINELQVNIDLAKNKMDNDALLFKKQSNLWNEGIGSKNELDQRELAFKSSSINYETAKLKLTQLQKQIAFQAKQSQKNLQISSVITNDYIVKSEASGRVYNILKEKGEMVNTQTPIAIIGDSTFKLELQVDEYDIAKIKIGQKIILTMDSYKGQTFEAVVNKMIPLMDERSKSFTIEAGFINKPNTLYPNLTCEANIVIQQKEKAITIPRNYLLTGDSVILNNNEKKKVIVGLKDYQKVEILSGLSVNDIILKPL